MFETKSCTMTFMLTALNIDLFTNRDWLEFFLIIAFSLFINFMISVFTHESNSTAFRTRFDDDFMMTMMTTLSIISRVDEMFVLFFFRFFIFTSVEFLIMTRCVSSIFCFVIITKDKVFVHFFTMYNRAFFARAFFFCFFLFIHAYLAARVSNHMLSFFARDAFFMLSRDCRIAFADFMFFRTRFAHDWGSTSLRHVFVFVTIHALHHRAIFYESFALLHFKILDKFFDQQSIRFRYIIDLHVQCRIHFFLFHDFCWSNNFLDVQLWVQSRVDLFQIRNCLRLIIHVDVIHFDFICSYDVNLSANRNRVDEFFDDLDSVLQNFSNLFRFCLNFDRVIDQSSHISNVFRFFLQLDHDVFREHDFHDLLFHHIDHVDCEFSNLFVFARARDFLLRCCSRRRRCLFDFLANHVRVTRFDLEFSYRCLHVLQNRVQFRIFFDCLEMRFLNSFLQRVDNFLQQQQRNRIIHDFYTMQILYYLISHCSLICCFT